MREAKRLFYNKMITSFITIAYSLAWARHSPRPLTVRAGRRASRYNFLRNLFTQVLIKPKYTF